MVDKQETGTGNATAGNPFVNEFDDYLAEFANDPLSNEDEDFLDMYNMAPRQRFVHELKRVSHRLVAAYRRLPLLSRILLSVGGGCLCIIALLIIIFHNRILIKLVEMSNDLEARKSTPFILIVLIFFVAFPPVIGFSLLSTSTGLIYGVTFRGWFILAVGAVTGSIASFATFQTILHSRAEKLIRMNRRLEALASILQENNSYWILALLRLCPFPYSLTNGAIAAVYGISLKNFAIANIITTPKLLAYLFIGSRVKSMGETDSAGSRLFDLISILLTIIVVTLTAWLLYFKTKKKYMQLQNGGPQQSASGGSSTLFDPNFDI